jgi:transcriptional regulator GlxA family with amidase domain
VHVAPGRIVDDGDLVTAGGVTSGLDLGLYLLEREVGPKVALAVEQMFAHERRGVVWRDQGPAPVSAADGAEQPR